ncbi:MAG: SDR family NAD(P)-dependent oxidoreductase [Haloarculaceae archaeon]
MVELDLSDRPSIVTGASRGIGKATAAKFAAAGGDVVICSRSLDRVEPVAEELTADNPGRVVPVECDVTDPDAVRAMVDRAIEEFGGLSVVVNNAGGANTEADLLHRCDPDAYHEVLELNLVGPYLVAREALPALVAADDGAFVHIGSVNGLFGIGLAGYSEAKSGLLALSRNVASHYGRFGVRSNVLSAGTIETEARREEMDETAEAADSARQRWLDQYALGRFGRPGEVADAALFLASERSSFVTGTNLLLDGGLTTGLPSSFLAEIYDADERPTRPGE